MITVEKIISFKKGELEELTDATMGAVEEGIGFGWITPPPKNKVKKSIGKVYYWFLIGGFFWEDIKA